MTYRIEVYYKGKCEGNYGGGYTTEDVKMVTKGYKPDPEFSWECTTAYTRKNSTKMFFVTEE
jgi:hypothetical protein